MNALGTRLIRLAAALLLARLAAWGVVEVTPETHTELQRWVEQTLDLLLYAADAWLAGRSGGSHIRGRLEGNPRAQRSLERRRRSDSSAVS